MNLSQIIAWAKQTTTGVGFSAVVTGVGGALTHTMSWGAAAPIIAGGIISMAWPQGSAAAVQTIAAPGANLAGDLVRQALSKKLDLITDAKDALALLNAVEAALAPAAPSAPSPTGTPVAA